MPGRSGSARVVVLDSCSGDEPGGDTSYALAEKSDLDAQAGQLGQLGDLVRPVVADVRDRVALAGAVSAAVEPELVHSVSG